MSSDTGVDNNVDVVQSILEKLNDVLQIDLTEYRRSTIERRLQRRINFLHCCDEHEYLRRLDSDPEECRSLLCELTVKFSEFYRDPALWRVLEEEVFPDVIRRKIDSQDHNLRIWTAGSATGEETYTATMVLDRVQQLLGTDLHIDIISTDIDANALARAKHAEYSQVAVGKLPDDLLQKYLSPTKKNYIVPGYLRRMVSFKVDNVLTPAPADGSLDDFDIVFCRNVLIYFTRPAQFKALERLTRSLKPGGILVLGTAEVIPRQFEAQIAEVRRELRIYKRR